MPVYFLSIQSKELVIMTLQNISTYSQLEDLVRDQLEYSDPLSVINDIYRLFKSIKRDYKVTICSGCQLYKHAGAHCRKVSCVKFMQTVKCPKCAKNMMKLGHHRCQKNLHNFNPETTISNEFDITLL